MEDKKNQNNDLIRLNGLLKQYDKIESVLVKAIEINKEFQNKILFKGEFEEIEFHAKDLETPQMKKFSGYYINSHNQKISINHEKWDNFDSQLENLKYFKCEFHNCNVTINPRGDIEIDGSYVVMPVERPSIMTSDCDEEINFLTTSSMKIFSSIASLRSIYEEENQKMEVSISTLGGERRFIIRPRAQITPSAKFEARFRASYVQISECNEQLTMIKSSLKKEMSALPESFDISFNNIKAEIPSLRFHSTEWKVHVTDERDPLESSQSIINLVEGNLYTVQTAKINIKNYIKLKEHYLNQGMVLSHSMK